MVNKTEYRCLNVMETKNVVVVTGVLSNICSYLFADKVIYNITTLLTKALKILNWIDAVF